MRFRLSIAPAILATLVFVNASDAGPVAQSGMMSLGTSQKARINVANLLSPGFDPRPDACQVSIRFLDDAGEMFVARNGRAVATTAALPPGQSAALELAGSLAPPGLFRAVVEQVDADRAPNPCAGIVITIEVYDTATGKTRILEHLDTSDITDGPGLQHVDDNGPPDRRLRAGLSTRRFGLVGLAAGEHARLHVVNLAVPDRRVDAAACSINLSFVDQVGARFIGRDGSAISRDVSLAPGASSQLDLSFADATGDTSVLRQPFRPVVDAVGGRSSDCTQVRTTMEIVDVVTGRGVVSSSFAGTVDSAEPLQNGAAIEIDGSLHSKQYFKLDVPPGATDLRFDISGGTGDADLYVKFGALPTTSSYDARPYKVGNDEHVHFDMPASGTWYVMVRGYASYANVSLSGGFTPLSDLSGSTELTNGLPVTGLTSESGIQQRFFINVPAGRSNLKVQLSGGTGDADLYVKYGDPPTTTSYSCRPYLNDSNENCFFTSPAAGLWHVMVRGYTAYNGVMLTATYSPAAPDPGSADFALNVSPTAFVLAAGTSISITVNTTTLQGGPQSIALAVGGLPANVTGVLSPAIVTSGQSATLTLTAAANAVLGDKAITVTGAAGLVAHQVVAVLSVVP